MPIVPADPDAAYDLIVEMVDPGSGTVGTAKFIRHAIVALNCTREAAVDIIFALVDVGWIRITSRYTLEPVMPHT